MKKYILVTALFVNLLASPTLAFRESSFSFGIGHFAQNFYDKVAVTEEGDKGMMGEIFQPLVFQYDFKVLEEWYLAPQLSYTLFGRKTPGDTATVNLMHLLFPVGMNAMSDSGRTWDWYFGPGYLEYKIKGEGGKARMNNGTGTATFAIPGREVSIKKLTNVVGTSFEIHNNRFAFDLIFENFFSNEKRTQNIMLSYAYKFGGQ